MSICISDSLKVKGAVSRDFFYFDNADLCEFAFAGEYLAKTDSKVSYTNQNNQVLLTFYYHCSEFKFSNLKFEYFRANETLYNIVLAWVSVGFRRV